MSVTVEQLRAGTVALEEGVTISPIEDSDTTDLVALRFTHPTPDGGTCSRIMRLSRSKPRRGKWWSLYLNNEWYIDMDADFLDIDPSIMCPQHHLHGWVEDGEWWTTRRKTERWMTKKWLGKAADMVAEYGGDVAGATLAVAEMMARVKRLEEKEERRWRLLRRRRWRRMDETRMNASR